MKQHLVEKQVRGDKDFVSSMGEKFGQAGDRKTTISAKKFQCVGVACRREAVLGILAVA
ncbi:MULTISPECIES: hypothetical protein [unclassified Nostoc]|uniref:hypothetical protein n=1 Tax=unclassified Nostoc TaxID=2593658 RepID=UPI001672B424|nr:hypothetical protein [Nostoc sp. 'Peltigera membranacea cyanobiont' 232]